MQSNFLRLLVLFTIFLCFSYLLSASAIPATRTQNLKGETEDSSQPSLAKLEHALKVGNGDEVEMGADFIERRIDIETQDYPGTGANGDHDPKSPGGV